jgi:hypothetical protein
MVARWNGLATEGKQDQGAVKYITAPAIQVIRKVMYARRSGRYFLREM